ncbi:hypothetical protein LIER_42195 [Lithospermum erythrorhizon]|uniref:Uncharacterized protein n=1 Tax=Lithospermum erythrorhizon TaxID=34254 RepID=A0AAV3RMX0_LITER
MWSPDAGTWSAEAGARSPEAGHGPAVGYGARLGLRLRFRWRRRILSWSVHPIHVGQQTGRVVVPVERRLATNEGRLST